MEIVSLTILLSVLQSLSWTGFFAATIAGGLTYDAIKGLSTSFITKFLKFFENHEQAEEFLKKITEAPAENLQKPVRDVRNSYEKVTNKDFPEEFYPELTTWLEENKAEIEKIVALVTNNDMKIVSQNAGRDILNIQGNTTINNK